METIDIFIECWNLNKLQLIGATTQIPVLEGHI